MQIKTTMRCHFIPARMAIVKKSTNNKCWGACGEKENLLHCWWECKFAQSLWITVWRFLRKLNIELPYDPAIHLLGICPYRAISQKDTSTPLFIAALFTIAKTSEKAMATHSNTLAWKVPWMGCSPWGR